MKLDDLTQEDTRQTGSANISDDQLKLAYEEIHRQRMSVEELNDIAADIADRPDSERTKGSYEFILARLHTLIHGYAPYGMSETRAETMFRATTNMAEFVDAMGYDVKMNIEQARGEMKIRAAEERRRKELSANAQRIVLDYYKTNKDELKKTHSADLSKKRDELVAMVSNDVSVEDAFNRFIK